MKKILTLTLCLAAVGSMSAQKANVDAAKKLAGKPDKIADARQLLEEAKQNPETAEQANTWYVAGQVEYGAFDANNLKAQTVPGASVDSVAMGRQLVNAYKNYLAALPLDSLPNEKGQVKPKVSKKIAEDFAKHLNDYFNFGVYFYNLGPEYRYPDAFETFYTYGDIPSLPVMAKQTLAYDPEFQSIALYNAGIAAYFAGQYQDAYRAFNKARLSGATDPTVYIYEIGSLQTMQQNDSTMQTICEDRIYDAARAGFEKFGIEPNIFVTNILNYQIAHNMADESIAMLNELIDANPESGVLYGLRAYANDRMDNSDAAEADYRKAAELPGTDLETLRFAAMKLYRAGTQKYNAIEGNGPEAAAARQAVKADYFDKAKAICERGLAEDPTDNNLRSVLDSVDYALDTYF